MARSKIAAAMAMRDLAPYHFRTLYLFTFSDIKTIIIPSTLFGLTNAIAFHGLVEASSRNTDAPAISILGRCPLVLAWVWMHLLPLDINNQLSPSSIAEDELNKPWRPLPSRRLTPERARTLMLALYGTSHLFSLLGTGGGALGLFPGLCITGLGIWYNNLGGGNSHPLVRNLLNGLGYLGFLTGALEVALGTPLLFMTSTMTKFASDGSDDGRHPIVPLHLWLGIIGGIITTTIQGQDLYDQEGDAARGRRTIPLVFGDWSARWSIAVAVPVWTTLVLSFWSISWWKQLIVFLMSGIVALRVLAYRSVAADRRTFAFWNLWVSFVFVLPLVSTVATEPLTSVSGAKFTYATWK